MFIEVDDKFLDELEHTSKQLRLARIRIKESLAPDKEEKILNDITSGFTLLEAILDSTKDSVDAQQRVINREGHTHVVLTCFCLSNEWLGQ